MFYIPNKLLRVFLSFLLLFTLHRKNLFDTTHEFAYYSFYNGYRLVTSKGSLVWDKRAGGVYTLNTFRTADSVSYRQKGEAYL